MIKKTKTVICKLQDIFHFIKHCMLYPITVRNKKQKQKELKILNTFLEKEFIKNLIELYVFHHKNSTFEKDLLNKIEQYFLANKANIYYFNDQTKQCISTNNASEKRIQQIIKEKTLSQYEKVIQNEADLIRYLFITNINKSEKFVLEMEVKDSFNSNDEKLLSECVSNIASIKYLQ